MNKKVITKEMVSALSNDIKDGERVDEQISEAGMYEITSDHTFRVNLFLMEKENRWVLSDRVTKNTKNHWVDFRIWTFDEETDLKKKCTIYDPLKRTHFLDYDMLNRLKVQKLIKRWSFEEDNPRLKLFHVNGVLTDESYKAFAGLFPNIVRKIIEEMNYVLESNG